MIYADTDVLLSIFCPDDLTETAHRWYGKVDEPVVLSSWSVTEFRANIGLRIRKSLLSRSAGLAAMLRFDAATKANRHVLAPVNDHFILANEWLTKPDCSLRSGDALHLAIAVANRCRDVVTFDRPLGAAARRLKLPVTVLNA